MSNGLSFATTPQITQQPEHTVIQSDPFFPQIDLDKMRQAMRIDNTVTSARLYELALEAVIHVNQQLELTKQRALNIGKATLGETNTKQLIDGESILEIRYRHAVYNYTKANLSERYADFDATSKTASRAEAKQENAHEYRREGHAAIADIKGVPRTDCELI